LHFIEHNGKEAMRDYRKEVGKKINMK